MSFPVTATCQSHLVLPKVIPDPDRSHAGLGLRALSIMGLRVRDTLSDRKYHGTYERIAQALRMLRIIHALFFHVKSWCLQFLTERKQ